MRWSGRSSKRRTARHARTKSPVPKQFVNDPDAVEVKEIQRDNGSIIELRVAKEDLGRVIGRQGRIAKAMRAILNAVAVRTRREATLEIVEEK
jgi:uncharacterized protein